MAVGKRHNLLFLGAVILPSVLLAALSVLAIRQEDELARKRAEEQNQRVLGLARQELLNRLEALRLRAAGPGDPDVALEVRIESGRIILPWEDRKSTAGPLLERLRDPVKAQALLRTSPETADEYGVPVAVYAARRLAAGASAQLRREIDARMREVLGAVALSPSAAHMIAEICPSGELHRAARDRAAEAEVAEKLAGENLDLSGDGAAWRLYGDPPWLLGTTGRTLIAVRALRVLDSIRLPGNAKWLFHNVPGSVPLGEEFPGLRISSMHAEVVRSGPRQLLYFAGLLLMIALTLLAAYLLHRDIRRENRLADLRSQFVASVSHELRTPIATIRAFAEMIDMGRVKGDKERAEYVRGIVGESERLSRLVDGVLEFSRIEQGRRVYNFRPVALGDVLRSAARALEYPLSQGGFELSLRADPGIPEVPADREAIEQAVINLLGNAMKFSDGSRAIDLTLSREGNNAVIGVRDRGIGIPIEEQTRVFERFYRAGGADARQIPGSGLGLALVDYIAKAHGGSVVVESRPDQGSTFSIHLPIPVTT
jgi:signal transduction histidine kinase